jgi:hypothetical protein
MSASAEASTLASEAVSALASAGVLAASTTM